MRSSLIESINNTGFDILIFGGGITGAGIALDATLRGLKVLLIEQNDFASGTSSRSTKLVHGGLRYLEKLQFKFVSELGRERKILHDNAAHNVIPTSVILPIVKGGQLKKGLTFIAIKLYDMLAGVKKEYRTRWLSAAKLLKKYPYFEAVGLKGVFVYYEYKTNDGRLVIEILKKAVELGAVCLNHMHLEKFCYSNKITNGATLFDSITGNKISISAKHIVNATGPWCADFLKKFDSEMGKMLFPTKGVHIVISKQRFFLNEAFYVDTHDKRMVFAIPRKNFVYIGTTDTPYANDLRSPTASFDDINYLLKVVNLKFTGLNLTTADVESCWAGVRPLILENGKNPGEISRREEVFVSPSGIITITGGKLTGYRLMAKKVVDKIVRKESGKFIKCKTQNARLSGSNWENPPASYELIEIGDHMFDEAKQTGIDYADFLILFYRYGTNMDILIEKAYELRTKQPDSELLWIETELWYAVNYEWVTNLSDFCIFRSEMVLFENEKLNRQLNFMADCLAYMLKWSSAEKEIQIKKFNEHWNQYKIQKSK